MAITTSKNVSSGPAGSFLAAVDSFEKSTLFTDNFKDRDEFIRKYAANDEVALRTFKNHCFSLKMDVPAFDGGIEIPIEEAPFMTKVETDPVKKVKTV